MPENELSRTKWQCRRGMLELDVLLNRYLDQSWSSMDKEERQAFRQLLDYPDQVLQGWLCDGAEPDKEVAAVVRAIRTTDCH
jgi:antitoxin CptB